MMNVNGVLRIIKYSNNHQWVEVIQYKMITPNDYWSLNTTYIFCQISLRSHNEKFIIYYFFVNLMNPDSLWFKEQLIMLITIYIRFDHFKIFLQKQKYPLSEDINLRKKTPLIQQFNLHVHESVLYNFQKY